LANGNTLACGQGKMVEVDESSRGVWTLNAADIPGMGVRWFAGIQVLPNGNVLVCNAGGKVPFGEVNRQKQITWQWPSSAPAIAALTMAGASARASCARPTPGVAAMLSPGTFGHGGAWGTQAWTDPTSGVAYILMIQRSDIGNSDANEIRRAFQQAAAEALTK
jgi:CubicO group peptidase (beta-lactamase class C family)